MLHVLGGLAEWSLILQRTNEGRAKARAEGKPFGRRPKLTVHQRQAALKRLNAGETTREIALSYNVAHTTIPRLKPAGRNTPGLQPRVYYVGGLVSGHVYVWKLLAQGRGRNRNDT